MTRSQQRLIYLISAACLAFFMCYHVLQYTRLQETSKSVHIDIPTIVIDAGHGGEDGGATSVTGKLESEINLSISKKLEQIVAFCGMMPCMIRSKDASVSTEGDTIRERKVSDLKNRVETINHIADAIVVSIHQNYFSEEKYAGAQIFYAPTPGSKDLAALTQKTFREYIDPKNRRESKAASSVYLMNNIRCTGILVECGFISNAAEALILEDTGYQRKIAFTITSALTQYIEERNNSNEV